eukprot:6834369-Prymnesium_polylepis.1
MTDGGAHGALDVSTQRWSRIRAVLQRAFAREGLHPGWRRQQREERNRESQSSPKLIYLGGPLDPWGTAPNHF